MGSPTAVALLRHVWLHVRILVPQWFCPCAQCHHQKGFKNNHIAAPVKVARQQTTPELCWTFRNTGTLRNPPELSRSCLRKLHQHTPEPSATFRNLPLEPTPAHTGTLRNLPPEPTPAHAGTLRNLLEPFSGTCSSDLHLHTPQLIWAEDPVSLRSWGITWDINRWHEIPRLNIETPHFRVVLRCFYTNFGDFLGTEITQHPLLTVGHWNFPGFTSKESKNDAKHQKQNPRIIQLFSELQICKSTKPTFLELQIISSSFCLRWQPWVN